MKRFLLTYAIVFLYLVSLAQNEPAWVKKTPKPKMFNRTFFYQVVTVHVEETNSEAVAEKEAIEKATQYINDNMLEYQGNSREVVYQDGQAYYKAREGQSIKWPVYRLCQWHNPSNTSEWCFLYQIADRNCMPNYRFDNYDCQKESRKIYWRAGVESFFIPGLGQIIDKKQYVKGTCFFAGTAACVIGGLVANNNYQWYIDLAGKTLPGPTHSSYMDSADQWNKIEIGCFIAAGLCWVANVCDALFANPKNYNVSANVGDKSMTLSLNVKF